MSPLLLHIRNNFKKTPSVFFYLLFFSVVISMLRVFFRHSDKALYELIIPYPGGGFGSEYMLVYIAFLGIIFNSVRTDNSFNKMIKMYYYLLILNFIFVLYSGLSEYMEVLPEDYTQSNPYLRYTVFTPIYTILLPLFWILALSFSLFKYTRTPVSAE